MGIRKEGDNIRIVIVCLRDAQIGSYECGIMNHTIYKRTDLYMILTKKQDHK